VRQRTSLRVVALGQRLRRFVDHLTATVGEEHGERVRNWFQEKKAGWYAVLADRRCGDEHGADQAHNAIDRKLFAMKGFHHPGGVKRRFSRPGASVQPDPLPAPCPERGTCGWK